jgi:hypothetical protein
MAVLPSFNILQSLTFAALPDEAATRGVLSVLNIQLPGAGGVLAMRRTTFLTCAQRGVALGRSGAHTRVCVCVSVCPDHAERMRTTTTAATPPHRDQPHGCSQHGGLQHRMHGAVQAVSALCTGRG